MYAAAPDSLILLPVNISPPATGYRPPATDYPPPPRCLTMPRPPQPLPPMTHLKKHEGKGDLHPGETRSAPYPMSRLAPAIELVDLAREVARADHLVTAQASARLRVIADQIRHLQDEARKVLEETRRNHELHHVPCACQRRPGQVYHLYRRADGSRYFSMLSPADWGSDVAGAHEGSYRLEHDLTWVPADQPSAATPNPDEDLLRLLVQGLGPAPE